MEPGQWPSEHTDALRDHFLKGLSYAEIVREINARFGTTYTRNAVIGRAKRLGLIVPAGMTGPLIATALPGEARRAPRGRRTLPYLNVPPETARDPVAPVKLRCVGIQPRLIPLVDLAKGDCRYPYGGDKDGEDITFCGHPRQAGSSYCAPHTHLTLRSGARAVCTARPAALKLVFVA